MAELRPITDSSVFVYLLGLIFNGIVSYITIKIHIM